MKFELEESLKGAPNQDLLEDLRRCSKTINRDTITIAEYEKIGKTHPATIQRRFGSWSNALKLAGLQPSRSKIGITNEELFNNIKSIWMRLGRQPRYHEVRVPISLFSAGTYENRFGSWAKALREFILWINSDDPHQTPQNVALKRSTVDSTIKIKIKKRRTRREISDRQRFRILMRDGFCCRTCGASPLIQQGIELHVDHILPWSKGGETTDDNLETKCRQCNLGKGNTFSA